MSDIEKLDIDLEESESAAERGEALLIDVEGFEGPLHLLLALARAKKVDLRKISILDLADQYLTFISAAKRKRIDLAADYLVMAAWLAFLKSKLLLPKPELGPDPELVDAEAAAQQLAWRLMRLEALRRAAEELQRLPQLNREVFARGAPEPIAPVKEPPAQIGLFDLLKSYAIQRTRAFTRRIEMRPPKAFPLEEARRRLFAALGGLDDWRALSDLTPKPEMGDGAPPAASYRASVFSASLELVKDGRLDVRQNGLFLPIFVRRRQDGAKEQAA